MSEGRPGPGKKRVGLFGGAFNPVHNAHLRVAQEVRELCNLAQVVFIPSYRPPFKKEVQADFHDRVDMLAMAIEGNPYFAMSLCESRSEEPSYTALTLDYVLAEYVGCELFFIIGLDAFLDMEKWYKPHEILSKSHIVVVNRGGIPLETIEKSPFIDDGAMALPDTSGPVRMIGLKTGGSTTLCHVTSMEISSTMIRALVREGKSIKYLLPEKVESFIINKGLYGLQKNYL